MMRRAAILSTVTSMLFLGFLPGSIAPVDAEEEEDGRIVSPEVTVRDDDVQINAELQEAEDLIAEGKESAALDALHAILTRIPPELGEGEVHDSVHPYGEVIPPRLYLGSRAYVRRLLGTLSPETVRRYRDRFEPLAEAALEAARRENNHPGRLREVAHLYPLSRAATQARLILADLAFEAGDFAGAARALEAQLTEALVGLTDGELARVTARLGLCLAASGDRRGLDKLVRDWSSRCGEARIVRSGETVAWRGLLTELEKVIDTDNPNLSNGLWETLGGDNTHGSTAGPHPRKVSVGFDFPRIRPEEGIPRIRTVPPSEFLTWPSPLLETYPVLDRDRGLVYGHTETALVAVRLSDGKPLWIRTLDEIARDVDALLPRPEKPTSGVTKSPTGVRPFSIADMDSRPGRRLRPRPRYLTLAGGTLLASVEMLGLGPTSRGRPVKVLLALDRYNGGKVLWTAGLDGAGHPLLEGVELTAAPVVRDHRVFVGGRRIASETNERKAYVLGFHLETGELLYRTFLCSVPNINLTDHHTVESPMVSEAGGVLYCSTGQGIIGALTCATGEIQWLFRYKRYPSNRQAGLLSHRNPWRDDLLIVSGNRLYSTPTDSNKLHILFLNPERDTGAIRNDSIDKDNLDYLIGVDDRWLFLAGRSSDGRDQLVKAIAPDATVAALQWEFVIPNPPAERRDAVDRLMGRGLVAEDGIYVPTRKAIYVLDRKTGEVSTILQRNLEGQAGRPLPPGNLVPAPDGLLLGAADRLLYLKETP